MTAGLRERHKQEARQAISGTAMALFAAQGSDEVTISQVADASRLTSKTRFSAILHKRLHWFS